MFGLLHNSDINSPNILITIVVQGLCWIIKDVEKHVFQSILDMLFLMQKCKPFWTISIVKTYGQEVR